MNRFLKSAAVALVPFTLALSAAAAAATTLTYNVLGSYSAGPFGDVEFEFTITDDFSNNIPDTEIALDGTQNSFTTSFDTIADVNLVKYRYFAADDIIEFGLGGLQFTGGALGNSSISINGFASMTPSFRLIQDGLLFDQQVANGCYSFFSGPSCGISSFLPIVPSSLETAVVPLPPAYALLLGGFAALAGLASRRSSRHERKPRCK